MTILWPLKSDKTVLKNVCTDTEKLLFAGPPGTSVQSAVPSPPGPEETLAGEETALRDGDEIDLKSTHRTILSIST